MILLFILYTLNMFPYELANLISEYINIEYVDDMYGLVTLYDSNIVLYESLQYQTCTSNPDISMIESALNESDYNIRFKKLVELQMYHAALAMIYNNLIKDYNEYVGMLFDMSIERYDFEGSIIIANKKERCLPFKIFKDWIETGDEDQQNFIAENNKWFLSDNKTLWEDFNILLILRDYQFHKLQGELYDNLMDCLRI